MIMSLPDKIRIGVSSCLLGNNVRYDGAHKKNEYVLKLCDRFDCVALCPEISIGLGVPRLPIQLHKHAGEFKALMSDPAQTDVTRALQQYARSLTIAEPLLAGYVFKARSPSCGVGSTPWLERATSLPGGSTDGIFSHEILQLWPMLPVLEESQLNCENDLEIFSRRVNDYAKLIAR